MLTNGIECRTDSFIVYEAGPLRGLLRLCWAMSGESVFDGVRRAGFIRKIMKNYSLETETEWQLWMVE